MYVSLFVLLACVLFVCLLYNFLQTESDVDDRGHDDDDDFDAITDDEEDNEGKTMDPLPLASMEVFLSSVHLQASLFT